MMHVVSLILSMLFSVSQSKIIESQYSLLRNLPKISISFPNENSQVTLNLNTYLPFTFFSRSSLIAAINDTLYENSTVYLIKNYSSLQEFLHLVTAVNLQKLMLQVKSSMF